MAKDPAMLWYWGDWHSGTALFSRFLKGCYMDVLHAQFNHGRLSLEEIKICLGSDFGTAWPTLQKKFKVDENSLFFNERLEYEKNKRAAFTASRRNNLPVKEELLTDISAHINTHMSVDMENENENRNDVFKEINIDFDFFWNLYDKKVGDKEKLKKKWATLKDIDREKAMDHIPKYIEAQPDKKYRKDPATYLNNKSFNDEIITNASNQPHRPGIKPGTSQARTDAVHHWGPK
jgi:hypothetical protein